ncbi:fibrobacter succinogenes major paralogous domain-containing protein [Croceitalea marina]|uniref:Fibrobacter succinogenes major paralogous domain-containing protein n=1 Tax=Croceitalea marina TaxID=1775166 RepID=A0ABW5MVB9_9FLAO
MRLILVTIVLFQFSAAAQTVGSFTDQRDGYSYKTVTYEIKHSKDSISTMTWMAQNLNYKTESSYCYDDYDSNCEIMGRLYIWSAAMKACPDGWHLPDDEEWRQLADLFGGVKSAAKHLKSTNELWKGATKGTNKSLFAAMPYGHGTVGSGYFAFSLNATFWSATTISNDRASDWVLSDWERMIRYNGHKATAANSVRCIKD